LHDLGIDEKEKFIEGYGLKAKRFAEIAPFVKAFNLLNYADAIERANRHKDRSSLGHLKLRFASALDLYSLSN
jgi:hypothetical protein